MKRLFLASLLLAAAALFGPGTVANAQDVVGVSEILSSTNASEIDTYSATELSYDASLYYGAYVEGYLFDNGTQIAAGSAQDQQNAYGYISKPLTVGDTYEIDSYHYLVASYAYTDGGGNYFYNNPDQFTSGEGGTGGSTFYPGGGDTYVSTEYIYLGSTAVAISSAPPQISNIYPASAARGTTGTLTVDGQNLLDVFSGGTTPAISGSGITLSVGSLSATEVSLNYSIDSGASGGTDTLTLATRFGTSNGASFNIGDTGPIITSISPAGGNQGDSGLQVTISGSGFGTAPTVQFSGDGISVSVASASDMQIIANVTIDGVASLGDRQVTVTANGAGGQGFSPVPGGGGQATSGTFTVGGGGSYKLAPARLNLSTGDTGTSVTLSSNNGSPIDSISFTPTLSSNPSSRCAASLALNNPAPTTTVTATSYPCSGIFDLVASVHGGNTNHITVIIPPQQMIQAFYGETNSATSIDPTRAQLTMEALGNTLGNRVLDATYFRGQNADWQTVIEQGGVQGYNTSGAQQQTGGTHPELEAAVDVFAQSLPIVSVQRAQCFFTPSDPEWTNIKNLLASNSTIGPTGGNVPSCYGGSSTRQLIIKSSVAHFSSGKPFFIFAQPKQPSDPAVVTIP